MHLTKDKQRMLQSLMVVFQWKAKVFQWNELGKDKEENDAHVKENIFEILEDNVINKKDITSNTSNINYVVDGGYLLHSVIWDKPQHTKR